MDLVRRRLVIAAVVVSVVSCSVMAGAIYPYAGVETDIAAECFPANALGLGDYAYDEVRVATAPVASRYVSDSWINVAPAAFPGGHHWQARAAAELDLAAGTAKVSAATDFHLDNSDWLSATQPDVGAGFSRVYATVTIHDTLTLASAATVAFDGRIEGRLAAFNSHPDAQDDPYVVAALSVKFSSGEPILGDPDGMHETYGSLWKSYVSPVANGGIAIPGDWPLSPYTTIDEPLLLAVDLPEGVSRIDISFAVAIEMSLEMGPPEWSSLSGDADFGNTLNFQFIVPEGVETSSASGLLPVVVPEPATLSLLAAGGLSLFGRRHRV